MLNLSHLTKTREAIVPVLNKSFQYNNKKYFITEECKDGWYVVTIENNRVKIKTPAFVENLTHIFSIARGYTFENKIFFQNYDSARRNYNRDISSHLHFNSAPTCSSVYSAFWEDKKFYYISLNYGDNSLLKIKESIDKNESIESEKGITPEMRMLYLHHVLKNMGDENASPESSEKKKTSQYDRIRHLFSSAGAVIDELMSEKDDFTIIWHFIDNKTYFNTLLDGKSLMIKEAGYCMENDDHRHNITSLVLTAKDFDNNDEIFKTR